MKRLFILYGEQSAGKTSTLCKVFEMLSGHKLTANDPQPDFRIVFPVGNKYVYMATLGDLPGVIKTNFDFFKQSPHGRTIIYEFDGKSFNEIDKNRLKNIEPDICITACRTYKAGASNVVYNKVNECIRRCMPVIGGIQWIAKLKGKGTRSENKIVNTDHETALQIVSEIMKECILKNVKKHIL